MASTSRFAEYYRIELSATATIDGQTVPVSLLDIDYILDEIATARIELPLGREVGKNTGKVSGAMGLITTLNPMTPIEIKVEAKPTPAGRASPKGKPVGFPKGKFTIFKGYVSGPEHSKDRASSVASLTVNAFGETVGLAGLTQYVRGIGLCKSVSNGGDVIVSRFGAGPQPSLVDAVLDQFPNIAVDVWKMGLLPFCQDLLNKVNQWTGEPNTFSRTALDRINKGGGVFPVEPLKIPVLPGSEHLFSKSLAAMLRELFFKTFKESGNQGGTAWNALQEGFSVFGFHFIPGVNEDAIAALTPNLGGKAFAELDPSEYYALAPMAIYDPNFYAYLTTVAVFIKGFDPGAWQETSAVLEGGKAHMKGLPGPGRMKVVPAPLWLAPWGPAARDSLPEGELPDKAKPTGGTPPKKPQGEAETNFFKKVDQFGSIADKVAETILHEGIFEHRRMNIAGRFRTDIAPGSTIKINTVGERFAGKKDTLYAFVRAVKLHIDCNGGGAYTQFGLSHLRSQKEHDSFTTKQHPLYGTRWVGAPLLK